MLAPMNPAVRPKGLDHPLVPRIMRLMSRANVWLYQRSGGRIGGTWRVGAAFPRGVPVLLLTCTGRKSGQKRTSPLLYLRDGDTLIVVASKGGLPEDPLWYLNVRENPDVEVQVGAKLEPRRARVATPAERERLWPRLVEHYRDFATYQAWTERTIPVVLLEPLRG
jgi:deazaflavin-dependent oxidoreductase (nitroreductase family)